MNVLKNLDKYKNIFILIYYFPNLIEKAFNKRN